jgi:hypothetical protein
MPERVRQAQDWQQQWERVARIRQRMNRRGMTHGEATLRALEIDAANERGR